MIRIAKRNEDWVVKAEEVDPDRYDLTDYLIRGGGVQNFSNLREDGDYFIVEIMRALPATYLDSNGVQTCLHTLTIPCSYIKMKKDVFYAALNGAGIQFNSDTLGSLSDSDIEWLEKYTRSVKIILPTLACNLLQILGEYNTGFAELNYKSGNICDILTYSLNKLRVSCEIN